MATGQRGPVPQDPRSGPQRLTPTPVFARQDQLAPSSYQPTALPCPPRPPARRPRPTRRSCLHLPQCPQDTTTEKLSAQAAPLDAHPGPRPTSHSPTPVFHNHHRNVQRPSNTARRSPTNAPSAQSTLSPVRTHNPLAFPSTTPPTPTSPSPPPTTSPSPPPTPLYSAPALSLPFPPSLLFLPPSPPTQTLTHVLP